MKTHKLIPLATKKSQSDPDTDVLYRRPNLIRNASPRWRKFARNITSGNTMFNQDFKE
jgi:hypothetical protein